MISLFNSTASKSDLIETNGDYILDMLCTSAIITEELNGEYSFDGIFRITNTFPKSLYDMLTEESILKVNEEYGIEYFRIAKVIKTNKNVTVFARHITISDTLTLWCEDVRPDNQNGAGAINWIYNNSIGNKLLTVNSDIVDTSTAYYMNKNVYEALFTADNSFLDRWGGEVYRRGFNLSINSRVGSDKGVTIRSKKNLTGFEVDTNINNLITRIYPKGYDGITISEKYIDSKYINNYARIYAKEVKFDDVKVNSESVEDGFETLLEAQEELKKRVNKMYDTDKIDLLTANYKVNFVELGKMEEYKDYSILEKTWLGDTVEVIEDTLGINIVVRVLKRKYDVLKNKRTETELSNKNIKEKPPTIQQIVTELEKLPTADNFLQIAKDQATNIINAGIQNSYVIVRKNEILIMDTQDINTATKVWRWNNGGLGYSSTGYYGQFGTAITNNGAIVADFISTGILNAGLIKAGVLSSFNNSTWINMENGTFNFADKIKYDGNKLSINFSNTGISDKFTEVENNVSSLTGRVAEIEVEADSITQRVGNTETSVSTVNGNVTNLTTRVNSAESKLTASSLTTTISSAINNGTASMSTTQFIMDTTGFTVKNGAIKVKNNLGNDVMWCNSEGWLTTANLFINGYENPTNLEIGGTNGNKGVGIRTNGNSYSAYLDFGVLDRNASFAQNVASGQYHRFITESSDRSTLNLVTPRFNIRNFTGYGNTNVSIQGYLDVFNSITTQYHITANGRITAGEFYHPNGNSLIATDSISTIKWQQNSENGFTYLEIATPKYGIWGANLWVSDIKLKENIREINVVEEFGRNFLSEENKIGLDLIKQIKHYSFDYKEDFGGNHIECGYIAQDLQALNNNLVLEVKQEDGTTNLQPLSSSIIPNLSLAIQEQQLMIEQLKAEIENLKAIVNKEV